ncbi:FecR family protein [Niveispirillum sp. KHB5.9]|uniref:FecR family protein n=1 Tax=Niveispirillum sp. KHB5.9 TaxID=3400269 RepID=UPI003A84B1FC
MKGGEPTAAMVEQAAAWHVRVGEADHDETALDQWLRADPRHRLAFDRMTGILDRIGRQPALERKALDMMFRRPQQQPRDRRPLAGAALAVLLLAGIGGWQWPALKPHMADERSAVGELRQVTLSDRSQLVLSSDTALDVALEAGARRIDLLAGEVMAEVAPDPAAPFTIVTPEMTAQALGTRYSVRREAGTTLVTVLESKVLACARALANQCVTLLPGQRARIGTAGITRLPDIDPALADAWTQGWLAVEDWPLSDLLAELNRWRARPVRYDPAALAGLRVSGHYPLNDTDRALAALAASLPVMLDRGNPESPVIRRR